MLHGLIVTRDILYFYTGYRDVQLPSLISDSWARWNSGPGISGQGNTQLYWLWYCLSATSAPVRSLPATSIATATQRNTLHPNTQAVLKEFGDSTLEVTLYVDLLDSTSAGRLPKAVTQIISQNLWDPYLRFKPDLKFNFVHYYGYDPAIDDSLLLKRFRGLSVQDIVKEYCSLMDLSPSFFKPAKQLKVAADLRHHDYGTMIQLKYQGRTAYVHTFDDPKYWPNETNLIPGLKRVLGHPIPSIGFSTGALERGIYKKGERDYSVHTAAKRIRMALVNNGFDIDTINLNTGNIPDDLSALVIADPKESLALKCKTRSAST